MKPMVIRLYTTLGKRLAVMPSERVIPGEVAAVTPPPG
jgi:hypothetical protein